MSLLLTDGLAALGGTIKPTPRREEPAATGSSLASCPYLATYKVGRNAGQPAAPEARSCCQKEPHLMRPRHGPTRHESRPAWPFSRPAWPFGSPWVRKGRTTKNRRPVTASLPAIARNCAVWGGILFAPEPVSAHRPPFTVGLTTSAVSGSSRLPPGSFHCGQRKMNPC